MIFLILSGKMIFLFPESKTLPFTTKMKGKLFEKIHGNMICSVYLVKMVFLFPKNMILDSIKKLKKDNIHPRKHGISSDRKIKDDKKVHSVKCA